MRGTSWNITASGAVEFREGMISFLFAGSEVAVLQNRIDGYRQSQLTQYLGYRLSRTWSQRPFRSILYSPAISQIRHPHHIGIWPSDAEFMRLESVVNTPSACEGSARAVAVQRGQASELPARAKALIAAQIEHPIFNVRSSGFPQCTRDAQLAQPPRFLTDDETEPLGAGGRAARTLRVQCNGIVAEARKEILRRHPGIDMPGGSLFPQFRADACWRDMENFTRVASYGCCLADQGYLDEEGCRIMNEIYNELEVPRSAMLTGVNALMEESLRLLSSDEEASSCARQSFKQLAAVLESMNNM